MARFDTYTQLTTPARGDLNGLIKDVSEALAENQTKYITFEDMLKFGAFASKVLAVTASGTVNLENSDPIWVEIDPNSADRDVVLPAAGDDNHAYIIRHTGGTNTLTIKLDGGSTVTTLTTGQSKYIIPSSAEDFTALTAGSGTGGGSNLSSVWVAG